MQRGSTADLVHSVPALVAYLSKLMTLEPGDIVSTGDAGGVGSLRDHRTVWLKPGDEVGDHLAPAGRAVGTKRPRGARLGRRATSTSSPMASARRSELRWADQMATLGSCLPSPVATGDRRTRVLARDPHD